MGGLCKTKKNEKIEYQKTNMTTTNITPSTANSTQLYNNSSNYHQKISNPNKNINNIYNPNLPKQNYIYEPMNKPINPNIQNQYKKSSSYGIDINNISNKNIVSKNYFTPNEYKKMKNHYINLIGRTKTIGRGGQAKIQKFYSAKFNKTLVKKVININTSLTAEAKKEEILHKISLCKEAILLSKCDYPNIVKIYDFIENPVTIVMEYCSKGSIRDILDKNISLPPLYKIFLICSICDGLGYIHYKGIVHGDLKCANILLSDEYRYYIGNKYYPIPKLADFGLSQISPNHIAAGTPGYIAPEIYEGSGLNKKTDIFALGMVMFEILSGLRPLPSDLDLAVKCLKADIPPCTKEVLRVAWAKRSEELLPGIKNAYWDAFYTLMIKCINDDPVKRPDIASLYITVRNLYKMLLKVSKEFVFDESEILKLCDK